MRTAIVTDTNSGLTLEQGEQYGIFVLPMPVIVEDETYTECKTITHKELFLAIRQKKNISSSQPSPGDIQELWNECLKEYDEIVYIPMSSGLSGSCESAQGLAKKYKGRVEVVDNHRISVTQFLSALDAKKLADDGLNAKEIKEQLELHAYDASIYIMVDTLEYLKRSGRVTPAAAAFASVLNLKPVLTIQGDKLDAFTKARGAKQGRKCMIDAVRKDRETRFKDVPDSKIVIATAGTFDEPEMEEEWRATVNAEFPEFKVIYMPLSCSIACHTGINAAGAAVIEVL